MSFHWRYVIVWMEFNTWRVLENVKILGRVFDEVEERNVFSEGEGLYPFDCWYFTTDAMLLKFVRRGFKVDWVKQVIKSYIIVKIPWGEYCCREWNKIILIILYFYNRMKRGGIMENIIVRQWNKIILVIIFTIK